MIEALTSGLRTSAIAVAVLLAQPVVDHYARVLVGDNGKIIVITEDGRQIAPPADKEQVGATGATIAPDRESVAWLALYTACCTPDPQPLKLVVLNGGKMRTLKGRLGEPIAAWQFQDGGKHVAFREEAASGNRRVHFERWDVRTGRRVADYTPAGESGGNGRVTAPSNEPEWVRILKR